MLMVVFFSHHSLSNEFDWSGFDRLLGEHIQTDVKHGIKANLLDYKALSEAPEMGAIKRKLANYDPSHLEKEEKLAFYINAYNYFTVKLISDNYGIDSIKSLGNWLSPVWRKPVGKINGQPVTLDQIEHDILRKMDEPRIHFAIVCASMSCPDLRNEAYLAGKLNAQLDDQIHLFLENNTKGAAIKDGKLYLSKIFSWFSKDFRPFGGVKEFVHLYREDWKQYKSVRYFSYNWKLNEQS